MAGAIGNVGAAAARVSVGVVSPTEDQNAQYKDIDDGVFNNYLISNKYEKDRHAYMMPIASPAGFEGDACAFVQLAAPTMLRVVYWEASKAGKQPPIPDPESKDPNWVLLDDHYELINITVPADGQTGIYTIKGVYVYGAKKLNSKTVKDLVYPRPPWLEDTFDRSMPENLLDQNLMDSSSVSSNPQQFFIRPN